MKADIHPKYQPQTFVCSCGNKFSINSTAAKDEVHLDVCDKCHPFYTGKQKIVVTGQVEKFMKRFGDFGKKEES